ncbi:alpha-L-rhamnosidase C-terminal domain-containing protein [Cohnella candidum]|uniref:Alpha-L-rhamnosidase n=1 Tax=Cohnella candidum TaxID=2674991 RepID=A0A3G3JXD9_9BACL|nr:alpha-L-rhamnosidase C-terminal domain-containing protein [Cohnella candidum]AYQ72908.1 alpha-L-rhamnosidase [Cohnella candidum]
MSNVAKQGQIPEWIWHPDRERRPSVELQKRFTLQEPVEETAFYFACTGSASIELDGKPIGQWAESPRMAYAFSREESFPSRLEAGDHTLTLRLACTRPMPIEAINIHLADQSVGCAAFLCGSGLWIPTDRTWDAGDSFADLICVMGEEPFGEPGNAPDWFIAGGYGDIEVDPVEDYTLISSQGLDVDRSGGFVTLSGSGAGTLAFDDGKARDELYLFYHLLKQNEWKERRSRQLGMDMALYPQALIELPREMNVRIRLTNRGGEPATVWWNGAESLRELDGYEACITEQLTAAPGRTDVSAPQGLRYIRLFVGAEPGSDFRLEIAVEAAGVPLRQIGSFDSDSVLMNRIHEVSVHTSRVCHQIGLWDGIKRDRLNWGYDVYMAAKSDYSLWDNLEVLRRSIRELGRTPYGYWINGLPSYTLWWLCGMWDYYLETGDRQFVLEMKEDILKQVAWVKANTDPVTGFFLPGARNELSFIEWSPMGETESWFGLNAIFAMAKRQTNRLAAHVPELGLDWQGEPPFLEEDVFLKDSPALLTTLLGIMGGYVGRDKAVRFLSESALKDPVTPLTAYWLAECCSEFGLHDKAWQAIRTVWGSMLETGASTFWEGVVLDRGEDFHRELTTYTAYDSYRMSLCHSWSSTPVVWINKHVLGIRATEPGYKEFSFEPHAVEGLTRCRGVVQSPRGPIEAEWSLEGGNMVKRLTMEAVQSAGGRS